MTLEIMDDATYYRTRTNDELRALCDVAMRSDITIDLRARYAWCHAERAKRDDARPMSRREIENRQLEALRLRGRWWNRMAMDDPDK